MKSVLTSVDSVLNRITMYRLVVYALSLYSIIGIGATFFGQLSSSATALVVSLLLLLISAYLTDVSFSRLFHVPTNNQSWLITALILFLIIHPATSLVGGIALVLAGAFSSASKFMLTINNKHLFNPAAISAALISLTGLQATTWWIGSSLFWPITLIFGLIVVRKVQRFPLFISFVGTALFVQMLQIILGHQPFMATLQSALISSPLIFLSTIMLTEPATMPPRRNEQMIFGAIVGILYVTALEIGPIIVYPEVALLLGNIYAYAVSPKMRLRLELKRVERISERVYNCVFLPDRQFSFLPGQYMEWTLAGVPYDSRGNRRSFTIASSPTEETLQLGIKYYEPASTYKATFEQLRPGDTVYASQLAGNFTLRGNESKKLAFIAGGIGITPFRSMIKYLADSNIKSDIVLVYAVSDPSEFAYTNDFREAERIGVRLIPVITQRENDMAGIITGQLDSALLKQILPDYSERIFYISGPNVMVDATKDYLNDLGITNRNIKSDHFSGY